MKTILKAVLLAFIAVTGTAHALPVSGQGTWETNLLGRDVNGNAVAATDERAVFLYDTDLDITWLRDLGMGGKMAWSDAILWAQTLTVGTFGGWSLPTAKNPDGGGPCFQNECTGSQMGHLYYVELGNEPFDTNLNWGPFLNVPPRPYFYYWSSTESAANTSLAWAFGVLDGYQYTPYKENRFGTVAVRAGDVLVSAVPEPESFALVLVALVAAGAATRRKAA